MRLLIAQPPTREVGGVNIRRISEETYERLLANPDIEWSSDNPDEGDFDHVYGLHPNGTHLIMTSDIDEARWDGTRSVGYSADPDVWCRSEEALDDVTKEER